jgi:hypothetical protein
MIIICILLIGILANLFLERQFRYYIQQNIESRNRQLVISVSQQFHGQSWDQAALSDIGINALEQGLFIKIVNRQGQVIWDAFRHNSGLCQQMMAHMSENMSSRYPNWKGVYTEKKFPVQRGGNIVGTIMVGYYGPFYYNDTDLAFINTINIILLGVLLLALVIALLVLGAWFYVLVFHRLCQSSSSSFSVFLVYIQLVRLSVGGTNVWTRWLAFFGLLFFTLLYANWFSSRA